MAKGKRAEESKSWQKVLGILLRFVPALCVVAVLAFFFMLMDMNKKLEEQDYDVTNIVVTDYDNDFVNNTVNNVSNNTVNNTVNNIVENTEIENTENQVIETNISGEVIPSQEDKDIANARKVFDDFWGSDSNSYIDIYKNENNEYIARVTLKQTGDNKYFIIDVEKGSVSEY